MKISNVTPLSKENLESMAFMWHTDLDNTEYVSNEVVHISQEEADAFYEAGNELYDMFVEAGEYVLEHDLLHELDIPQSLHEMVRISWSEDIHWHLYGRFDVAGGLDGKPIKLLEFNADTPTMVYESALIQWALLKANNMDESRQFNNLSLSLRENFKRLITLEEDTSKFAELYEDWGILFSSVRDNLEEEITTRFMASLAREAGFRSEFAFVDEVAFSSSEGVSFNGQSYEFFFKLIPWESIAIDEPELGLLMREMMQNKNTIFLNPAYTLMFQSKRMLKILYDLFPNNKYLLPASYNPLATKQVKKPSFGREGGNVEILDMYGVPLMAKDGIYGIQKPIYQAYAEQNTYNGAKYQPNIFFAYESCALGFRKGSEILDNFSKFVSHVID